MTEEQGDKIIELLEQITFYIADTDSDLEIGIPVRVMNSPAEPITVNTSITAPLHVRQY